jgi:enoyl-CoA hydratase
MTNIPHLKTIQTEIIDHVGWLRYARAPVNAFSWEMLHETRAAYDVLETHDDVRVIIIGSAIDSHMSTGADLTVFADATPKEMQTWVADCHALAMAMRSGTKPILAAIKGVAVGGGLEICLHADLRFADAGAKLGQPEINIAFIPPVAGTQALTRLVGRSAAFQMLYSGEVMSAEKALSIGLIDTISALGGVDKDVQTYAVNLAKRPANTLTVIRRCLIDGGSTDFRSGMEIEADQAGRLAADPNFKEGIDAFLAKRKPNWR